MHLRLSTERPDLSVPSKVILTTGSVSDSEMAVELVTEQNTTYVMDRGYINYSHFHKWKEAGISFVVRLQNRNKTQVLVNRPTPAKDPDMLVDADVVITSPQNPDQPVILRLVEFRDEKNRPYRLVTTRWDLTAREIADIYRDRWGIELFFKWMKQKLHLTRLYSYKETAVWNQIYLALIANAMCALVKLETKCTHGPSRLWKLIVQYVSCDWEDFLNALFRPRTRTSKGRQKKPKKGRPRKYPVQYKVQRLVLEDDFNQ